MSLASSIASFQLKQVTSLWYSWHCLYCLPNRRERKVLHRRRVRQLRDSWGRTCYQFHQCFKCTFFVLKSFLCLEFGFERTFVQKRAHQMLMKLTPDDRAHVLLVPQVRAFLIGQEPEQRTKNAFEDTFRKWHDLKHFIENYKLFLRKYSQTWANDHLRIATTCLQRPLFLGPNFNIHIYI